MGAALVINRLRWARAVILSVGVILAGCAGWPHSRWVFAGDDGRRMAGSFDRMRAGEQSLPEAVRGRTGSLTVWDQCGAKTETFYRAGQRDGEERKWTPRGVLISQGQWGDGLPVAQWRLFWPSGGKQAVLRYDKGRLHGICSYWSETGEKTEESEYSNGYLRAMTAWYTNGLIQCHETDLGGAEHRARFWTPDGRMVADGQYRGWQQWEGTFLKYADHGHTWTGIMSFHEGRPTSIVPLGDESIMRGTNVTGELTSAKGGASLLRSQPQNGGTDHTDGDGTSIAKAVVIRSARNETEGLKAEERWIKEHHHGWRQALQMLVQQGGRYYDQVRYVTSSGEQITIYFDITDFFAK